jgi:hypothetical protein
MSDGQHANRVPYEELCTPPRAPASSSLFFLRGDVGTPASEYARGSNGERQVLESITTALVLR